jgi:GrpB-like predicted nucleotidyltransferase (UPF0157 family)
VTFHVAPSHLARKKRPPTCSPDCRAAMMRGDRHWNWQGGRYVDSAGYVHVWVDGRYVREHVYVMEQQLGRPLKPWEVVHHKDENRQHNAPGNLELKRDRGTHTLEEHVVRVRGQLARKPGTTPNPTALRKQLARRFARAVRDYRARQSS